MTVASPRTRILPALLALPLLLVACSAPGGDPGASADSADGRDCVSDYVDGADYFPDKVSVEHAENFTVSYHGSYQVLQVRQSYQGGPTETYVLYQCGTPAPADAGDLAGATRIEVPIRSVFSGSTTHLPLLADLDRMDLLTGVSDAAAATNPTARQRVQDGQAIEYAPNRSVDTERVIAADPDILMTGGTDDPAYAVLRGNGVPVVANAEWLEETPLGRAEWVKYLAVFTGDEAKAEKVFGQIEHDYEQVLAAAARTGDPVTVLPGQMYEGVWYMPAGDSYVAALIRDANGSYPWADTAGTASVQLSLEEVLARGRDADVWLLSSDVATLGDVTADDPRYAEFAAFQNGAVWSNNARIGPGGGNDYWERGVTRPDLVLADLVTVLHPQALPGHDLEFHRQVGR